MNCIVCDDNIDMHNHQDILDCWKTINDLFHFKGDIVITQIAAWLTGPTAQILGGERAHSELSQAFQGPKKNRDELYDIIRKARSQV